MAAPKYWSNERKQFIRSLMPNKKILFANVNSGGVAKLNDDCQKYDIIVCYYKDLSIYIICKSEYHKGCEYSDFSGSSALFNERHKISVSYKKAANFPITQERFLIVPENLIEEFARHLNYYLDEYEPK